MLQKVNKAYFIEFKIIEFLRNFKLISLLTGEKEQFLPFSINLSLFSSEEKRQALLKVKGKRLEQEFFVETYNFTSFLFYFLCFTLQNLRTLKVYCIYFKII